MKIIAALLFSMLTFCCRAQIAEQTFTVTKPVAAKKTEMERLFDLKLAPGYDTVCSSIFIDLTPVAPYYDSLGLYNLKYGGKGRNVSFFNVTTIGSGGYARLKFYQHQKDNSYKLVYVRSFKIACKEGR